MRRLVYFCCLVLFLMTACNKVDIAVTGITLNMESVSVAVGRTVVLEAQVSPSNATNKYVIWSINNGDIASLSNGTVTGLKPGNAIVTAKTDDGAFTASCNITVTEKEGTDPDPENPDNPSPLNISMESLYSFEYSDDMDNHLGYMAVFCEKGMTIDSSSGLFVGTGKAAQINILCADVLPDGELPVGTFSSDKGMIAVSSQLHVVMNEGQEPALFPITNCEINIASKKEGDDTLYSGTLKFTANGENYNCSFSELKNLVEEQENPDVPRPSGQVKSISNKSEWSSGIRLFEYDAKNRVTSVVWNNYWEGEEPSQWSLTALYSYNNEVIIYEDDDIMANMKLNGSGYAEKGTFYDSPFTHKFLNGKLVQVEYIFYRVECDPYGEESREEAPIKGVFEWENDDLVSITFYGTDENKEFVIEESFEMKYSDEKNPFYGCTIDPVELEIFDQSYFGELYFHYFGLMGCHSKHCVSQVIMPSPPDPIMPDPEAPYSEEHSGDNISTFIKYTYEDGVCTGYSVTDGDDKSTFLIGY